MNEIQISDLQRVRLEPGDVLLVKVQEPMDDFTRARMRDRLKLVLPDNEVAIIDGTGAEVFIVEPGE